jgi:hypothetical protein
MRQILLQLTTFFGFYGNYGASLCLTIMALVYLVYGVKDPIKDEQKTCKKKGDWAKLLLKPFTEIKNVYCKNRPLILKIVILFSMVIHNLQLLATQV